MFRLEKLSSSDFNDFQHSLSKGDWAHLVTPHLWNLSRYKKMRRDGFLTRLDDEVLLCEEARACDNLSSESDELSIERDINFYYNSLRTFFVYKYSVGSVLEVAEQYVKTDFGLQRFLLLIESEEGEDRHKMYRKQTAEMLQTLLEKNDRYPFAVQNLDHVKIDEILNNSEKIRLELWIAYIETYHRIVRIRKALIAATAGVGAGALALIMRRKFPFLTTMISAPGAATTFGGVAYLGAKHFGHDLYKKLIQFTFETSSSLTRYRIFPKATEEQVAELKKIVSEKTTQQ